MEKTRYNDLLRTMAVQTASYDTELMVAFVVKELNKIKGIEVYEHDGNVYATKGKADTYPCIVAHTDTVHNIEEDFTMYTSGDRLFSICSRTMKRVGIGGDDKVGVFIALQVIKTLDVCKVAFFRDEEMGCVGSKVADMKFFEDVEFVLQCDRQGYDDFVNNISSTKLYSDEFSMGISAILSSYGRIETSGGLTDVLQLVDNGYGGCVANMSCGYYDPHSNNEYIEVDEVNLTLNMVLEIFEAMSGTMWLVPDKDRDTHVSYGGSYGYGYGLGWGESSRNYSGYGRDSHWYGSGVDNKVGNNSLSSQSKLINTEFEDLKDEFKVEQNTRIASCIHCSAKEILYDDLNDQMFCFSCEQYGAATVEDAVDYLAGIGGLEHISDDEKLELSEYLERLEAAKRINDAWDDKDDNMRIA